MVQSQVRGCRLHEEMLLPSVSPSDGEGGEGWYGGRDK